jgi:hypothetical protein
MLLDLFVGFGMIWFGLVLVGADHCIMARSFRYISSPNGRCQFETSFTDGWFLHFRGSMLQALCGFAGVHGSSKTTVLVFALCRCLCHTVTV